MQKRSLAVMAVVFAGLLAYVLLIEIGREEEREAQEDMEQQVLPTDAESIKRVRIESAKGTVEMEYRGEGAEGEWFLVVPFAAPADPAAAKALARAAATLSTVRRLESTSEDTAQYGLMDPVLVATLEAEGLEAPAVLRFGVQTGSKDGRYLSIDGDEAVVIVPSHEFRSLDKGVDDLRDRRLVRFSPGGVSQVHILNGDDGVVLSRDDGLWWVQGEPRYRAARMDVEDFLADLTTSRVLQFLDADDPDLGLDDSDKRVEVDLDGEGQIVITFGANRASGVIAQVSGFEEAAEVSHALVEPLDHPSDRWRTLEVADINPWQTDECRFSFGERSFDLLAGEDDAWTLSEDGGAPRAVTAERAREFISQIDRIEGTTYLDIEPGPRVGHFELSGEGQAVVRFTLHRDGDDWSALVSGDPAPLRIPDSFGLFMEEFLADPLGEDG